MLPQESEHELKLQEGLGRTGLEVVGGGSLQGRCCCCEIRCRGLGVGHRVPLHLGREVTNELTVCPPAPH